MGSRLAYSVTESCVAAGIGRTHLYELIARGELRAVKVGRRTLILAADLDEWLQGLPSITSMAARGAANEANEGGLR